MAGEIARLVGAGKEYWKKSAGEIGEGDGCLGGTDLIVTVGGDGTILRAAKAAVAHDIPLLGVNMGRLGFMTELRPGDALERIPGFLEDGGWIEERSMVKARIFDGGDSGDLEEGWHHALNDVVVTRGATPRLIWVRALVDGAELTSYRSDAVILSTATGSTGYNISAGGADSGPAGGGDGVEAGGASRGAGDGDGASFQGVGGLAGYVGGGGGFERGRIPERAGGAGFGGAN